MVHIPTEILTSAGGDALFHQTKVALEKFFQSDTGKKVAEAFGKKFGRKYTDKERAQMTNCIFGEKLRLRNPHAPYNIDRHLKYAAKHDWTGDNTLVKCLLFAFESERAKDKDGKYIYENPEDDNRLIEILAEIGDIDDLEEFRNRLERYDHDPAEQFLRHAGREVTKGLEKSADFLESLPGGKGEGPLEMLKSLFR